MAEVRALIVDDEPLARRGIRQLLAPHAGFVVVGECRDGREALRALATLAPDLVFLDVQMPGLDGFEVIRVHGVERMPAIVFVTAHDEFAVGAFEAQALDYLVKPLSAARFDTALARVRERMRVSDALALAGRLSALLEGAPTSGSSVDEPAGASARRERIAVPTGTGQRLLDAEDIAWIEAEDDHARIHAGGKEYRVRASLASLAARLAPARFVRVHRSALVRLDVVRELVCEGAAGGEAEVVLRGGKRLPVSRRRLAEVKARLRPRA